MDTDEHKFSREGSRRVAVFQIASHLCSTAVISVFLLLGLAGCDANARVDAKPGRGNVPQQSSPRSETFQDTNGGSVDPFLVGGAKALVFIFISTDCPISNRYAPEIQRLEKAYSRKGAAFWLVYPNSDERLEDVRKHHDAFRYSLRALLDPKHRLVALARAKVTPEAAVFLPDKTLLYHGRIDDWYADFGKDRPAPTQRDLQGVLDAILAGKPSPIPSMPAVGCYISGLP